MNFKDESLSWRKATHSSVLGTLGVTHPVAPHQGSRNLRENRKWNKWAEVCKRKTTHAYLKVQAWKSFLWHLDKTFAPCPVLLILPWAGEPRARHVPQTHHPLCNRKGNWAVEPSLAPPCETGRQGRGGAQPRWASARAHQYVVLPHFPLAKLRARCWNYLTYLKSAGESSPIRKKKENRRKKNQNKNNTREWQMVMSFKLWG